MRPAFRMRNATAGPAWPFHACRRRTVGGGPKTTGADEILWSGVLGGRPVHFTTVPRLVNALESFLTPSNMRLRDSHVGRSGHFIDLCVSVPVTDAELRTLERLAQSVDDRPVRARRQGEALQRPAP